MAWTRSVQPGEVARVTFEVKQSDYPTLYAWLMSLPYGKSSPLVREFLNKAICDDNAPDLPIPARKTVYQPALTSPLLHTSPFLQTKLSGEKSTQEPENKPGVTSVEETDDLFREMREQFR